MTTLTEVFMWFVNNVWTPVVMFVSDTFNMSVPLANVFVFFAIGVMLSALRQEQQKRMIKQAIQESQQ